MIGKSSYRFPVGEDIDSAEGSPRSQELSEPDIKIRTTTMPVVILNDSEQIAAEENQASKMMIHLPAEGTDSGDLQDAALESGQTDIPGADSTLPHSGATCA